MAQIKHNISLKPFNTFGLDVRAKAFLSIDSTDDYKQLSSINWKDYKRQLVIGGGSNLLFLNDFDGIIIHQRIKTFQIIAENDAHVLVEVAAGVVWDDFVDWAVQNNLGGIENLSDIPGEVGAAPVQNIGAYGVEAKDCTALVRGLFLENAENFELTNTECQFGYRDSIFKKELKGKVLVTSVVFQLQKKPVFNISYGNVEQTLKGMGEVSLKNIRLAIQQIRGSKLPNVDEIGNAGSFFKNPVVALEQYENLVKKYSDIPGYVLDDETVKVPAAWLIDKSGLKGYAIGGAAVHKKQALVLINQNNASGEDVFQLAQHVIKTVNENFGIQLSPEVNIID